MTRSIGGALGMHELGLLAGDPAQQHRPADTEQLQAEVLRLHRSGHSALFISEALHIDQRQVEQIIKANSIEV